MSKMYTFDTSTISSYLATLFSVVGGVFKLDPEVFKAYLAFQDRAGITILIVFIGGLSLAFGKSITLFANRVKPGRFITSLVFSSFGYIVNVFVVTIVIWLYIFFFGLTKAPYLDIAALVGIVFAPYWLGVFVFIPTAGIHWERILKGYVFIAFVLASQSVIAVSIWRSIFIGLLTIGTTIFIEFLVAKPFQPYLDKILTRLSGSEAYTTPEQIYHEYARRSKVKQ
jgi:hypothetical protein